MRANAFTLPELLACVAVCCTLIVCVQPLGNLMTKQRLQNEAADLAASLRFARTRAVVGQTGVTIAATGKDWGAGWHIFADPNRNAILDPGEELFLERRHTKHNQTTGNRPLSHYVHFTMNGDAELINGGFQAGTLYICGKTDGAHYKIVLSKSGRIRTEAISDCPSL